MTTARDEWLRARERKRAAVAWSSALGAYLLIFGAAAIMSIFAVQDLADYSGPVIVRLGSPEGVDAAKPVPEPLPAPVAPEPSVTPVTPETPETPVAPQPVTTPKPVPKPAPAKAAAKPSPPPTPAVPAPKAQPTPAQPRVVLSGKESGNSYDMTIDAGAGDIGRSFYVPIWLFLPVPNEVPASVYEKIPDALGLTGTAEARRELFAKFYRQTDGKWLLKNWKQPDYENRKSIWVMLEEANFDINNPDFKQGNQFRPVVILFKVSAPGADGKTKLEAVHLEVGSGNSDIDNDVLYGFKKAEFSNSGSSSISGRFTYRF